MPTYIFDLDYTLYSETEIKDMILTKEYYESFKKKPYLKRLLKQLSGDKYIFTNGNYAHMEFILKKMGLTNIFNDYVCSDDVKKIKPHKSAYEYVVDKFNLKNSDDTIYFFEDTIENLKTAKKFGWKTILIYDGEINIDDNKHIDHYFRTVEDSIIFLTNTVK